MTRTRKNNKQRKPQTRNKKLPGERPRVVTKDQVLSLQHSTTCPWMTKTEWWRFLLRTAALEARTRENEGTEKAAKIRRSAEEEDTIGTSTGKAGMRSQERGDTENTGIIPARGQENPPLRWGNNRACNLFMTSTEGLSFFQNLLVALCVDNRTYRSRRRLCMNNGSEEKQNGPSQGKKNKTDTTTKDVDALPRFSRARRFP